MSPRLGMARRAAALLAATGVAAAVCGCGSSSPGRGRDPAEAVPASAPLYAGATVRPTGTLQARARAVAEELTHQRDPYLRLLGALQTPGSPTLDFKRDLSSWLGAQAGIFLTSAPSAGSGAAGLFALVQDTLLGGSTPVGFPFAAQPPASGSAAGGAIVLDTTNAHAAQAFLSAQAARAGAHPASYGGVRYQATSAGVAFALVGGFAVIGSESGVRDVIDTVHGGPSLQHASSYAALGAHAPAEALAHVYSSGKLGAGAAGAASSSPAGAGEGTGQALALLVGTQPADVWLLPAQSSIAIDADSLSAGAGAPEAGLLAGAGEAARTVGELPAESFVALGFGSGAPALARYARLVHALTGAGARPGEAPPAGISLRGLLDAILTPLNAMTEDSASARRDFQSWMGRGAIFASGSGLANLRAGLVISSGNPALSRTAVAKLGERLRADGDSVAPVSIAGTDAALSATVSGLPVPLDISDGRDAKGQTKFVIGLGEASVSAALNPSGSLSGAPAYANASSALGEGVQPAVIVTPPTLLSLLEGVGLTEDPTLSGLLPYLRSLQAATAGGRELGAGVVRLRLVLSLRSG